MGQGTGRFLTQLAILLVCLAAGAPLALADTEIVSTLNGPFLVTRSPDGSTIQTQPLPIVIIPAPPAHAACTPKPQANTAPDGSSGAGLSDPYASSNVIPYYRFYPIPPTFLNPIIYPNGVIQVPPVAPRVPEGDPSHAPDPSPNANSGTFAYQGSKTQPQCPNG